MERVSNVELDFVSETKLFVQLDERMKTVCELLKCRRECSSMHRFLLIDWEND